MLRTFALLALLCAFYSSQAQFQFPGDTIRVGELSYTVKPTGRNDFVSINDTIYTYTETSLVGGFASTGELRVSGQMYSFRQNFFPGPISSDPNSTSFYGRTWTVRKTMVDSFLQGYYFIPPIEIRSWPAHGRSQFGESFNLAPFVDANSNGYYDPMGGDYPLIKGDISTIALFNDSTAGSIDTSGRRMHIEGYAMFFAFNPTSALKNTLFKEVVLFNRSGQDYSDTYLANFADMDCGWYPNDLIMTDVGRQALFAYDATPVDSTPFGLYPKTPYSGTVLIQGPEADYFDGLDNDWDGCVDGVLDSNGICVQEDSTNNIRERIALSASMSYINSGNPISGVPETDLETYYYLTGRFMDGTPIIIENPSGFLNQANGDGYVPGGSGPISNFIYPGNTVSPVSHLQPQSPTNWFQSPGGLEDVKGFISMGPFTWEDGEAVSFISATYAGRIDHQFHGNILDSIGAHIDGIRGIVTSGSLSSTEINQPELRIRLGQSENQLHIYNDMSSTTTLYLKDLSGRELGQISVAGNGENTYDVTHLPTGVYILQDISGDWVRKWVRF